tara:strand:- start:928 stop:1347 length:420 start_codon:yes stop_codon:yes gene_type:complete
MSSLFIYHYGNDVHSNDDDVKSVHANDRYNTEYHVHGVRDHVVLTLYVYGVDHTEARRVRVAVPNYEYAVGHSLHDVNVPVGLFDNDSPIYCIHNSSNNMCYLTSNLLLHYHHNANMVRTQEKENIVGVALAYALEHSS